MTLDHAHGPDHVVIATDDAAFKDWPEGLREEMLASIDNGCVGTTLVSETDRVRVWHLHIAPGERCGFHRHVNPYFWSCTSAGMAKNYFSDGRTKEAPHYVGQTRHFHYGPGDHMLHSVENTGDTMLSFTTVEFLDGTNEPLAIPPEVRLAAEPAA